MLLARDAALWGDEFHSLRLWRSGWAEIVATYDHVGSGLALPLLQRISSDLLGETVFAARLPALLAGLSGLALVYPVARRLAGPRAAALAAIGLAFSPIHLFYSHFARSYSLAVLLALVLADGIGRLLEERRKRTGLVEIGVAAALLPWSHLAASAILVAGALGAAVAVPSGSRRALGLALVAGAIGAVLLYLPARESLFVFVEAKAAQGPRLPFGALDVATVIAGSRAAALVWLLALPLAALGWLRAQGAAGAPLAALALAPAAVIAVVNPTSNAVAFSRYLLASVPFALLLLAWGALRAGERVLGPRYGPAAGSAALLALLALGALRPVGAAALGRDGIFANTYLGLHPVAALDAPPASPPEPYRALAARDDVAEVLEIPGVRLAGALLYRSYAREHRRPVRLGSVLQPRPEGRAYARAERPAAGCRGVQVVVAHTELERELREYLGAAAATLPARDAPVAGPLLAIPPFEYPVSPRRLAQLRRRLGPPRVEPGGMLVWEVPCRREGQGAR